MFELLKPNTLSFITTYKCTASCSGCCFECNSSRNDFLHVSKIQDYLIYLKKNIPSIKLIVFTGGECFLLGSDLYKLISLAKKLGFLVRVITNGYWASNIKATRRIINQLKIAGLDEINISSGDAHQEYVEFENAALAATESAKENINAVLVIEESEKSKFKYNSAISHPTIVKYFKENPKLPKLHLLRSSWIANINNSIVQNKTKNNKVNTNNSSGCKHLFNEISITPDNKLYACCGLSLNSIHELCLGNLEDAEILNLYMSFQDDILLRWIQLDGPYKILEFLKENNYIIDFPKNFSHQCEACSFLYNNKNTRQVLSEVIHHHVSSIAVRSYISTSFFKQIDIKRKGKA